MLLLGESGRQAIYYHIEKISGIKRSAWHKNPEAFAEALQQIFGFGAQFLLKAVAKELCHGAGLKFEENGKLDFIRLSRMIQEQLKGNTTSPTSPSAPDARTSTSQSRRKST